MSKASRAPCLLVFAVATAIFVKIAAAGWLDDAVKQIPTSIPGAINAVNTNFKNMPKSIPSAVDALENRVTSALPEQKCGSCGCLYRANGRCVACKPKEQCEFAENFKCSCPTGHVTNKWEKQRALETKFCAGQRCGPTGCCGGVRYGRQEGGTEALNFATQTALACAACTYGCGACAGAMAQKLIMEELQYQVREWPLP